MFVILLMFWGLFFCPFCFVAWWLSWFFLLEGFCCSLGWGGFGFFFFFPGQTETYLLITKVCVVDRDQASSWCSKVTKVGKWELKFL